MMTQRQMDGILHRPIECDRCQDEGAVECTACGGSGGEYRDFDYCKCSKCKGHCNVYCDCLWGRNKQSHELGVIFRDKVRAERLAAK